MEEEQELSLASFQTLEIQEGRRKSEKWSLRRKERTRGTRCWGGQDKKASQKEGVWGVSVLLRGKIQWPWPRGMGMTAWLESTQEATGGENIEVGKTQLFREVLFKGNQKHRATVEDDQEFPETTWKGEVWDDNSGFSAGIQGRAHRKCTRFGGRLHRA